MDKKKIGVIAILVAVAIGYVGYTKMDESKPAVRTERVMAGSVADRVLLEGVVVPDEATTTTVYAEVPVVIEAVESKVGSRVERGDVILAFTAEAKKEAEKALEEVAIQLNTQENLKESVARQATNAKYEAEVSKKQAEVNRELLKADAISSIEVSKSEAIANKNQANYEDLSSRKIVEEQKYSHLKMKHDDLAKKLKFVEKDLRAPKSGIVTSLPVEGGAIIREGQKIVSIAEEGNYKIAIEAPANLISSIKEGAKATVRDLSNSSGESYEAVVGKVSRVAREDAKRNKIIDVELNLVKGEGLNPGFITAVEIGGAASNSNAKMVDVFSVVEDASGTYVYTVADGVVQKVPVQIGMRTAAKYELVDIPEGTEIVVNPAKVQPGERVRVIK